MNYCLRVVTRKISTVRAIVQSCSNWPQLLCSRLFPFCYTGKVKLRSGFSIHPRHMLKDSWGEIFEAAVADVYGVRGVQAPDFVWDIGANIGAFTCLAAATYPGSRIMAYEPDKGAVEILRKNLHENGFDRVKVVACPVTKDGRSVEFSVVGGGGGSNIYSIGPGKSSAMPSVTLNIEELQGARSLFVKLDCEGAEGEIIEWFVEHSSKLPEMVRIVAEYHPWCPITPDQSMRCLAEAGFTTSMMTRFGESYLLAERKISRENDV